jgi:hypothetical protein
MSRIDKEEFSKSERNITRIFIASSLHEALKIEKILTANGIDYAVEIEPFIRTGLFASLFVSEASGAAFYVSSGQASFCRDLLRNEGFLAGIVEEDQ